MDYSIIENIAEACYDKSNLLRAIGGTSTKLYHNEDDSRNIFEINKETLEITSTVERIFIIADWTKLEK